jgi:hypothetical protein
MGRPKRLSEGVPAELPLLAVGQHLPPGSVHGADQGQVEGEVLHLYVSAAVSSDHKQVDLPLLLRLRHEVGVDPRGYPEAAQVSTEPVKDASFVVVLDVVTEEYLNCLLLHLVPGRTLALWPGYRTGPAVGGPRPAASANGRSCGP